MITASLVVASGLAAVAVISKRSAADRHWVLCVALGCAALAPVFEQVAPRWEVVPVPRPSVTLAPSAASPPASVVRSDAEAPAPEGPAPANRLAARLRGVWLAGSAASLFLLVAGLARLSWLSARARPVGRGAIAEIADAIRVRLGVTRPVQIRLTPHPTLLATYGWLRPRILLPQAAAAWPAERLRAVLTHEMAHVRRGDWVPLMLAQLVRAAHWFNPLMWVAARRLGHESERACDDMVLELGVGAQEYAAQLLEVARAAADGGRQPRALPVLPVAHRSNLERRVKAMLNAHVNRSPVTWRIRVATTAALAGVALVGAGLGAAAQTLSTFSGVVVDPTKSGIPRATVVLTNEERQTKHEVRSDEAGRFEFVGLPPGEYRLEARVPGFSTMKGSVRVAGYDVGLTVTLSIGSVHETVTVSSAPPAAAPTAAGQQVSPGSAAPGQGSRSTSLAAAEGCRPSAAGGQLTPPRKLKHVPPVYPADLAAAGIGGTVVLDGRIGTDGTIDAVDVKEAVDPRLATAAADAVRQWRFSPTLLNCAPVEVNITTTVRFVPAST